MIDELKKKISEFVKIAESCPEKLQEKCFEVLLLHYLNALTDVHPKKGAEIKNEIKEEKKSEQVQFKQQDISENALHVKARHFLKKYILSLKEINQIFYKEGDNFLPLYEDLKTTKITESQIRIALLQALKNSLSSGNFEFDIEQVRQECIMRKCYDAANFVAIFKKNTDLFDKFPKDKKLPSLIKLSESGRETLANLIKELQ